MYRVDHVLGMPLLHNLLAMRTSNRTLREVWSAEHITEIDVLWEETLALEGRAAFYDSAGPLTDVIHSHVLQVLCVALMEPAVDASVDACRDRTVDVLRAARPGRRDPRRTPAGSPVHGERGTPQDSSPRRAARGVGGFPITSPRRASSQTAGPKRGPRSCCVSTRRGGGTRAWCCVPARRWRSGARACSCTFALSRGRGVGATTRTHARSCGSASTARTISTSSCSAERSGRQSTAPHSGSEGRRRPPAGHRTPAGPRTPAGHRTPTCSSTFFPAAADWRSAPMSPRRPGACSIRSSPRGGEMRSRSGRTRPAPPGLCRPSDWGDRRPTNCSS